MGKFGIGVPVAALLTASGLYFSRTEGETTMMFYGMFIVIVTAIAVSVGEYNK